MLALQTKILQNTFRSSTVQLGQIKGYIFPVSVQEILYEAR